nr:MAG TPA: hypothetical protein [Caudoviricetes sp.]
MRPFSRPLNLKRHKTDTTARKAVFLCLRNFKNKFF